MADDLADPYANLQPTGVVKKDPNAFPNPYEHLYAKPPASFQALVGDLAVQVPVGAARVLEAAPSFIPEAVGAAGRAVESAFPSTAPDPVEASRRQQLLDLTAGSRAWMRPISPYLPDPQNPGGQIGRAMGEGVTGMVTGSPMALPRSVGVGVTSGLASELAGQGAEAAGFPGVAPAARAAGMLGAGHVAGRMAEGAAVRGAIRDTSRGIRTEADQAYENFRNAGFGIRPDETTQYTAGTRQHLEFGGGPGSRFTGGLGETNAPQTWAVLRRFDERPFTNPTEFQAAYQSLGNVARDARSTSERMAARMAQERLLDTMQNLSPGSLTYQNALTGINPTEAIAQFQQANQDWAALMRGQGLDRRIGAAELRAGANYSGMNLENELRRRVGVLGDPNTRSGLSAAEQQAARRFAEGDPVSNARRWAVNLLGGRGGLGAVVAGTAGAGLMGGGHFADINPMESAGGTILLGLLGAKYSNMRALQTARNFELDLLRRSPYAQAAGVPATRANVPYSMVAPTLATLGDER